MATWTLDMPVRSRDGETVGHATGSTHPCRLEGCKGVRITVRWPDDKITYPCSKGLEFKDGEASIK